MLLQNDENTTAILNSNLRKAARTSTITDAEALISEGANGIILPTDGASVETVFKIAADACQLEMFIFLIIHLPRKAAFTNDNHKSNDWLMSLIKQGKTEMVLAFLEHASWIRTLLNGFIDEESRPIIAYFNEAFLAAVQLNQIAVVKALLEKGCLCRSEYSIDANTAIALAKNNKNAQLLALLMRHNLDTHSDFTQQTQRLIPDVIDLALANIHRDHPVFFIIENYLIVHESTKNYDGDFRKKIEVFATILRFMAKPNDPLVNQQNVFNYLKEAYPTSGTSEFRRTFEALYVYNSNECHAAFQAYQAARHDETQRTLLENSIIEHVCYGSNPLFRCHYYLLITESRENASPETQMKFKRHCEDFCTLLILLTGSISTLQTEVAQVLGQMTTEPLTLFGYDSGVRRPRFSTFPNLLNECRNLSGKELKEAYVNYLNFLSTTRLNPDFTESIKKAIEKPFLNEDRACILGGN